MKKMSTHIFQTGYIKCKTNEYIEMVLLECASNIAPCLCPHTEQEICLIEK